MGRAAGRELGGRPCELKSSVLAGARHICTQAGHASASPPPAPSPSRTLNPRGCCSLSQSQVELPAHCGHVRYTPLDSNLPYTDVGHAAVKLTTRNSSGDYVEH